VKVVSILADRRRLLKSGSHIVAAGETGLPRDRSRRCCVSVNLFTPARNPLNQRFAGGCYLFYIFSDKMIKVAKWLWTWLPGYERANLPNRGRLQNGLRFFCI
jgi:hypothetical protein